MAYDGMTQRGEIGLQFTCPQGLVSIRQAGYRMNVKTRKREPQKGT